MNKGKHEKAKLDIDAPINRQLKNVQKIVAPPDIG